VIAHLRGELIDRLGGAVVVECAGVGYEVSVSAYTMNSLPPIGEEVRLRVFTHASENNLSLFGFSSAEERRLFDLLITVKRVGPSSAIKILSAGAGPQEIAQMIAAEKTSALTSLKGVGKKTAEMIVVELREKCEMLLATWGASGLAIAAAKVHVTPPSLDPMLDNVRMALVNLGFKGTEADRAVATLAPTPPEATLESLLKQALQAVPR